MPFYSFISQKYDTTHENEFFQDICTKLKDEYASSSECLLLLGNVTCSGNSFDAIILKSGCIAILEFKNYGGELSFSENGPWTIDERTEVKAANFINPLNQVKTYRNTFINFLVKNERSILINNEVNWRHIDGIVFFHRPLQFDHKTFPSGYPWFDIIDINNFLQRLKNRNKNTLLLTKEELFKIPELLGLKQVLNNDTPSSKKEEGKVIDSVTVTNIQEKKQPETIKSEQKSEIIKLGSSVYFVDDGNSYTGKVKEIQANKYRIAYDMFHYECWMEGNRLQVIDFQSKTDEDRIQLAERTYKRALEKQNEKNRLKLIEEDKEKQRLAILKKQKEEKEKEAAERKAEEKRKVRRFYTTISIGILALIISYFVYTQFLKDSDSVTSSNKNNIQNNLFDSTKVSTENPLPSMQKTSEQQTSNDNTTPKIETSNFYKEGIALYDQKLYEKAIEKFTKAIEINPNDALSYNSRGAAKLELKNYPNALTDLNKAIQIDPSNVVAYRNRARVEYELEDYNNSIKDYNKAIELSPGDASTYSNLGWVKVAVKDDVGALENFNKTIQINPNYADAYRGRGVSNYDLKNYSTAIEDDNKAIELSSGTATDYLNLAESKYGLKYYDDAILDLNRTIQMDKTNALAYYIRGRSKYYLKDYLSCCDDFKKSCSLGYNDACNLYKECKDRPIPQSDNNESPSNNNKSNDPNTTGDFCFKNLDRTGYKAQVSLAKVGSKNYFKSITVNYGETSCMYGLAEGVYSILVTWSDRWQNAIPSSTQEIQVKSGTSGSLEISH